MIADLATSKGIADRRRLPKATLEERKANKKARGEKYRRKGIPAWGCHRRRWTAKEDYLILHPKGLSDFELGKLLGRSRTCIQVRRSKLKHGKK
ncbi:hypothetical protein EPO17_03540 [Patescibacteria group bacterium]|nr:MAG: hypothetical protein EPO17_03540 [Patescibacteria group bacterium]